VAAREQLSVGRGDVRAATVVLQWAHANDCPWDEYTCTYAAKGGHLEVLQWARVNGCPWNKWTCINATKGGHDAIVQWAKANGAPYGAPA
jgi:hypothetical protein